MHCLIILASKLGIGPPALEDAVVVADLGGVWWERDWVPCSLAPEHQQCLGRGCREESKLVEPRGGEAWRLQARLRERGGGKAGEGSTGADSWKVIPRGVLHQPWWH